MNEKFMHYLTVNFYQESPFTVSKSKMHVSYSLSDNIWYVFTSFKTACKGYFYEKTRINIDCKIGSQKLVLIYA